MGVTGLWQILQPCARPIKIETLNRKRLAVDASIWIYQFLKAVRDKEGNALRNSHVVGFFRRICKLLFIGIKPVFVFDGGAPVLKRQTIMGRKRRREGRREDAVRTAGRLLAVQMQRRAEEEEQQRRTARRAAPAEDEVTDDSNLVYVDELQMNAQERRENRRFRKKDAYHLPDLDVSLNAMGAPSDPRIMSLEELEAYARQFDTGEDINVYDFSKIDYDSPFFMSLPASDRYNILNAARLRSRLRMGHSKEQLDNMFPDRMAFSRFQIERVQERNELTQRLMNINDPNGDLEFGINGTARVAGEKGREYVLVRNDGVEGGWALGVVSSEGRQDKPIEVDQPMSTVKSEDESSDDAEDFEDVPIEGLNRLPKRPKTTELARGQPRTNTGRSRPRRVRPKAKQLAHMEGSINSLFLAESSEEDNGAADDKSSNASLFEADETQPEEDEDLRRAIAMSLETDQHRDNDDTAVASENKSDDDDDMLEVFHQTAVEEPRPIPQGSARAIASVLNKRSHQAAPDSHETTSFGVPVRRESVDSEDDDGMDLQAALAQSRGTKRKAGTGHQSTQQVESNKPTIAKEDETTAIARKAGFSGPLPFEKLDLGASLLGKGKMKQRTEEAEGGFINPESGPAAAPQKAEPLPPWFSGNLEEDMKRQRAIEAEDRERTKEFTKMFQFQSRDAPSALRRADTGEVIDLEAEEEALPRSSDAREIIDLDDDLDDDSNTEASRVGQISGLHNGIQPLVEPDETTHDGERRIPSQSLPLDHVESPQPTVTEEPSLRESAVQIENTEPEEAIDWSDSDGDERPEQSSSIPVDEQPLPKNSRPSPAPEVTSTLPTRTSPSRSPSLEFEDVDMTEKPRHKVDLAIEDADDVTASPNVIREETTIPDEDEFDDFSDPEEEELLKALTLEAEEHARFASSLNNKSQAQNIIEYEKELKQLRSQQKQDRRDADEVTHIMVQECQQLLRLFGLPYVTAPMEAEAQCAELVRLGLVDGIVTDDSDCFLFGGTRVYKNMFNQAKLVECYLHSDLEKEFDLTRTKLIQIAQLLGSDYTEGLPGVGPVTALEILTEFGSLDEFKAWLLGVQLQRIPSAAEIDDRNRPFRKRFRRTATRLVLPPTFPDPRVEAAYLQPDVDADPQPFQWGVPDLDALRSFLMTTIGWSAARTDEVLVPVIRDMNRRIDEGTQANMTAFVDGSVGIGAGVRGEAFAPRQRVDPGKRMGKALGRMAEQARAARANQGTTQAADSNTAAPEPSPSASTSRASRGRKPRRKAAKEPLEHDD